MSKSTLKRCPKCGETKSSELFSKHKNRYDGLSVWCKDCMKIYSQKYSKKPEVKKRAAENALRRYHEMNDDQKREYNSRTRRKGWYLNSKYNKDIDWLNETLNQQNWSCAICLKPQREDKFLSVDHDHLCCPGEKSCGLCVRGLLCVNCNAQLGFIEKNNWLESAEKYINNWKIKHAEQ